MYDDVDLPNRAIEVLEFIDECHHPTTSTLREAIYWASKNQHVHYRLDQLEERNLVETWKDEDAGGRGALAPRRARLTDEGEQFLELVEEEDETPDTVEERLDKIEKRVENAMTAYGDIKKAVANLEQTVEEHDDDLDEISEEVENVKRFVGERVDD